MCQYASLVKYILFLLILHNYGNAQENINLLDDPVLRKYFQILNQIQQNKFSERISKNKNDASAYVGRAAGNYTMGKDSEAINDLKEAIRLKTDYDTAYFLLASIYSLTKEYQLAISAFSDLLKINPNYPKVHYHRGLQYYLIEDYQRALDDFNYEINAIKKFDNRNFQFYYWRGHTYYALEKFQETINDMSIALDLFKKSDIESIKYSEIHINILQERGSSYINLNEFIKAIKDLDEVIELNPNISSSYNDRGLCYGRLGDNQKALLDFQKALKMTPTDPLILRNMGIAMLQLKNEDAAIFYLKKAAKLGDSVAKKFLTDRNIQWQ